METRLAPWMKDTAAGERADRILRSCVHCGFCLATCPTYQILGDELDSPRGRIYQIKQVLEGGPPTRETQVHLDRCLTCRSCETTCPSGVAYGQLVDIGRAVVAHKVARPPRERLLRWLLREGVTRSWLFGSLFRVGRALRWAMPDSLRAKIGTVRPAGTWPRASHTRKVVLLNNCVQPAMMPSIDAATARVLDACGVQSIQVAGSGCCGAIRHHLDDHSGALDQCRANIDAWWPLIESGEVEAIVMNASGCGAMVRDYGDLLRDDAAYAQKARRVSDATRDLAEYLPGLLESHRITAAGAAERVVFHPPCTLQHGQKIRGQVERLLQSLGAHVLPLRDAHLCCGSAGTYSLLQRQLATELRDRKLRCLLENQPEVILSANIGCLSHLQGATATPVRHWVEWVDSRMSQIGKNGVVCAPCPTAGPDSPS